MKNRLVGLALVLLACLVAVAPASAQANVAGTWNITIEGPEGPAGATAVLEQEGATFSGTITVDQADAASVSDGKIDGNALSFQLMISVQGMDIALAVSGEVAGDSMTGQMSVPDIGEFAFSGERAGS